MPLNVTMYTGAIQYTGSNGTTIDATISPFIDFVFISESGGVLNWSTNGNNFSTATNEWILYNTSTVFTIPNSLFVKEWMCNALCGELATTNSDVDAVEADVTTLQSDVGDLQSDVNTLSTTISALSASISGAFVRSMGVAPVPTLILGASTTVAVQIQPAMPDSSYSAYAGKFAGVSLTDLQINSVTVVDTDTVNVAVENVGLGTITGASVIVHAID